VKEYANLIYAACLAAYVRGAVEVVRKLPAAAAVVSLCSAAALSGDHDHVVRLGPDPVFDVRAAESFIRSKTAMTREEFASVSEGYRRYAFTVARVDSESLVAELRDKLADAVAQGQTREEFAAGVNAAFDAAGVTRLHPYHLQTVFETNVMAAYSAANWDLLHSDAARGLFRFYEVNVVEDERTCPICGPLGGVRKAVDDPFWETRWPPYHMRCRCTILALDADNARGLAAVDISPAAAPPAPGFGLGGGSRRHWRVAERMAEHAGRLQVVAAAHVDKAGSAGALPAPRLSGSGGTPRLSVMATESDRASLGQLLGQEHELSPQDADRIAKATLQIIPMRQQPVIVPGVLAESPLTTARTLRSDPGRVYLFGGHDRARIGQAMDEAHLDQLAARNPYFEDLLKTPRALAALSPADRTVAMDYGHEFAHVALWEAIPVTPGVDYGVTLMASPKLAPWRALLTKQGYNLTSRNIEEVFAEDIRVAKMDWYLNRYTWAFDGRFPNEGTRRIRRALALLEK